MSWDKELNLQHMDETVAAVKRAKIARPATGWLKAIRCALGMSTRSLGERIGLSQARVSGIEKGEINGVLTLNTLEKVAQGLGCRVVYALVPESESLQAMREDQAMKKARALNRYAERHMELEDQGTEASFREDATRKLAEEYLRTWPRDFWDD
ncbi:mobile mystery protein A [Microbulbifer rhizosphaerae]|uniref:Putative DNA-binding mobile mystery protein A n=1 Tax=Microbulbifer rhizosphaerae TaxID=1562603 RepID=A0A7W4ZB60_9GAMM|nr:mobile mystery protein A [Microbulbifer rhizosphaerae]MBB3063508.1 putative DNA-binding mobile mystery protein A [Microbulbifer rhizosphaerae]